MGTPGTCGQTRSRSHSGKTTPGGAPVQRRNGRPRLRRQFFRLHSPRQIRVAIGAEWGLCLHDAGAGGAAPLAGGDQVGRRRQHADNEKSEQGGEHKGEQVPEARAVPSLVRELSYQAAEKYPDDGESNGNEERSHNTPPTGGCACSTPTESKFMISRERAFFQ